MDWLGAVDPVVIARILGAVVVGGAVGLERQLSGKPAGLRTNILICVGSAIIMILGIEVATTYSETQRIIPDPLRVIQGVVAGIGFLGGGVILQSRGSVYGLTTAAGIWVVAALGVAVGAGYAFIATVGTVTTIITLHFLEMIERGRAKSQTAVEYAVKLPPTEDALERLWELTDRHELEIYGRRIETDVEGAMVRFSARGLSKDHRALAARLVKDNNEPGN